MHFYLRELEVINIGSDNDTWNDGHLIIKKINFLNPRINFYNKTILTSLVQTESPINIHKQQAKKM